MSGRSGGCLVEVRSDVWRSKVLVGANPDPNPAPSW